MSESRQQLSSNGGFTLIELLIVIVIIGILLAIAVPSYLGFRDRAQRRAVQSDLRAAIPSAEVYFNDHGTYGGMTAAALKDIDAGLASVVAVQSATPIGYCLEAAVGSHQYSMHGPGATWYTNTTDCTGSVVSIGN
jgi:type IV pilus assembly protein PilA